LLLAPRPGQTLTDVQDFKVRGRKVGEDGILEIERHARSDYP